MRDLWLRMRTGWTFQRVLYIALGAALIGQSVVAKQWIGILFGGYFASMGLFAFGCAGGNCYVPPDRQRNPKEDIGKVEFEEVKEK